MKTTQHLIIEPLLAAMLGCFKQDIQSITDAQIGRKS